MEMSESFFPEHREEILKCTSCGFCQAACPVFGITLRPAYNTRGKMLVLREMMEGLVAPSRELVETFYSCTTCGACTPSCPRQIKAAGIIEEVRGMLYAKGLAPPALLGVRKSISAAGNIFGAAPDDRIGLYPPLFRQRMEEGRIGNRAKTLVFMGCLPSYLDMKTVPSLIKILEKAEVAYTVLGTEEICCGFPLYLAGSDEFESHAEKVMERIRATGVREVVTPCAGCYKTFATLYPGIKESGIQVYHTVQYLDKLVREEKIGLAGDGGKRVTYHDPCDLGRACGIFEEPRRVLERIPGLLPVEMAMNRLEARCCGGGGGLQAFNPDLAVKMASRRVRDALAVGAEIIVSGCPACKDSLRKGARAIPKDERGGIKVMDITEAVAGAMS